VLDAMKILNYRKNDVVFEKNSRMG